MRNLKRRKNSFLFTKLFKAPFGVLFLYPTTIKSNHALHRSGPDSAVQFPGIGSKDLGSTENYKADFTLSMLLFTGGQISNGIKISRENMTARALGVQIKELGTAHDCRQAYLGLMLAGAVEKSVNASLKRVEIIRENVRNLYNSGVADSVDILETELAYQQAQQKQSEQKAARVNASRNLARLVGTDPNEIITPIDTIPAPSEPENIDAVTADMIKRVELELYDHKILASEYMARMKKSDYLPTLSTYVGYAIGKPYRDFFNNKWDHNFVAGLSLNWSFNLGGKTGNSSESAQQQALSARMSKIDLQESLRTYADIAHENLKLAYDKYQRTSREYQIVKEKFRLAGKRQQAGEMTVNRLLEIETELTSTEELFQASKINYYLAESEYLYAIGSDKLYGGL